MGKSLTIPEEVGTAVNIEKSPIAEQHGSTIFETK